MLTSYDLILFWDFLLTHMQKTVSSHQFKSCCAPQSNKGSECHSSEGEILFVLDSFAAGHFFVFLSTTMLLLFNLVIDLTPSCICKLLTRHGYRCR